MATDQPQPKSAGQLLADAGKPNMLEGRKIYLRVSDECESSLIVKEGE